MCLVRVRTAGTVAALFDRLFAAEAFPGGASMKRRNLRGFLPVLLIAGAATDSASGQQALVNYPTEIRRALVVADEACRRAGGTRVTLSINAVRKLDLNGDGRDDYIVDFHEAECVGRASFFCGTGGCDLLILVALRGGALRKVFDDRVREYEILSGRGPSEIRFILHGSYCSGHGNPSCEKTHRITPEPFKFEQPN